MSKQLVGNNVYIESLDTTYLQKGRKKTFCHLRHESNFAHNNLKQALEGAMLKAIKMSIHSAQFIPVAFGRINHSFYDVIGMIRLNEDQFEFSNFDPSDLDREDFDRFPNSPELKIISSLNSILKNRPNAPYRRNLTTVKFNVELSSEEEFDQALSTLLYALSAHLTKEQEEELRLILNSDNTDQ